MNITTSRRSVLCAAVAASVSLYGLKAASAQPIQPISPVGPANKLSFQRHDGSQMFADVKLHLADFGSTIYAGVQIVPTGQELRAVLDTGATHFEALINIANINVTDFASGAGDRLRSAGSEVFSDEKGSSFLMRCLNIVKPDGHTLRWEADRLVDLTATLTGLRVNDGSLVASVYLIPCIYRLVGENDQHVYARDTNGIMLYYDRESVGDPVQLVDSYGNTEFPFGS